MWQIEHTKDIHLLQSAYAMQEWLPTWLGIPEQFSFATPQELAGDLIQSGENFIGVNGKGQTIIHAEYKSNSLIEGHLFCTREVSPNLVTATIQYGVEWVFKNTDVHQVTCNVRKKHRSLRNIVENAGFSPVGYEVWKGSAKNKKVLKTDLYVRFK